MTPTVTANNIAYVPYITFLFLVTAFWGTKWDKSLKYLREITTNLTFIVYNTNNFFNASVDTNFALTCTY